MRSRRLASLALILVLLSPGTAGAGAEVSPQAVFDLIAERLSVMQGVAAFKRARDLATEDKAREAVVLDKATEAAAQEGIEPSSVRPFFAAQIEAAKVIQRCWRSRWDTGSAQAPATAPDLKTEIRPRLIALGEALLTAIAGQLRDTGPFAEDQAPAFRKAVDLPCLDAASRDAIFAALRGVSLAHR